MGTRILVVDDDAALADLLAYNLRNAQYEVQTAGNGREALRLAREVHPDLILLDLMLPEIDGLDVCRELRKDSPVPLIMITARGEETDRVVGLELGADDYIVKPFSAQELLARVRAVLRRAERQQADSFHEPIFRHRELTIDLARAQVFSGETEAQLTATEYRLLQTLAASMGRVLTADELLSTVWGPEYKDDKEILWVCLSRLRQKIEPDPKSPVHIVTRQGIGYLMPSAEASAGVA